MIRRIFKQSINLLLVLMMLVIFVGCNSNTQDDNSTSDSDINDIEDVDGSETINNDNNLPENILENDNDTVIEENLMPSEADEYGMSDEQKNSFSMLYHLAIIAEQIRTSKNNRLMLDDIYDSLLNDINPGAIDEKTQDHLTSLRDTIKSYINISVKRDRLKYIYNQQKAAAIRSAVPNPIAMLSTVNSLDLKQLAINVAYTLVDSYVNYLNSSDAVEQQYILSGWELDDEETEAIYQNRERAFDYMVDIVQEYKLDGKLTLNERSIETFNEICMMDASQEKAHRLEMEYDSYKLLGNYWLELAETYYEIDKYSECINAINEYNNLTINIFRKDNNYADILPKVIIAAQNIYEGNEYVEKVNKYTEDIIANTDSKEWSIRYFAAEVYLDLYSKTNDSSYLEKAFDIAYDNVIVLLDEQRKLNNEYIADVVEVEVEEPDYDFMTKAEKKEAKKEYKAEKKEAAEYNKTLKKKRETELIPIYEPLTLNCDLLFALADVLEISQSKKDEIDTVLHNDNNPVFLIEEVNDKYSFSHSKQTHSIDIDNGQIVLPVTLLPPNATINVTITNNGNELDSLTCEVSKVKRNGKTVDAFDAYLSNKILKNYEWENNDIVKITINSDYNELNLKFKVTVEQHKWPGKDKIYFKEI